MVGRAVILAPNGHMPTEATVSQTPTKVISTLRQAGSANSKDVCLAMVFILSSADPLSEK